MITNTEINVLKVMASKTCDWNWMNLDRALATQGIPGFSNVVNIINNLSHEGLVNIEDSGHPSMPYYRVTEKGHQLLREINDQHLTNKP
ncbi:MarR family transcriptional regulator [Atlantibacter hermannii]|uniref:MarR family transcriptional regulator n=1 Tax=Atlantibacter hermannii TaxID=565 RepID=UPI001EE4CDC0|nr:MarR family transcriptional regulator [Atlantibacter hermannii]MCZ7834224.1 MarR family transcriptional regulator [Atlantibacter hermannii]